MNRKIVAISIGILFVLSLNTVAAMNERETEIGVNEILEGETAVDFKIPNFFNYNEYFMLENFTGKLLLLDLMAAWCPPCNEAMPEMKQLYDIFGGSGVFEILSIAVDENEPRSDLEGFHMRHDITWPMAWDLDQSFNAHYGSGYIPTYYLISADGLTVEFMEIGWAGFDFYFEKVKNLLEVKDETAPVIHEFSEPLSNETFSIDNNKFDVALNVSDNWSINAVSAEVTIDDFTESIDLYYDDKEGLWIETIAFDLAALYNAETVELKYKATDYFENTVETTAQSYPIEFIEDAVDPTMDNFKPRHDYDDESFVKVNVDARDNYEIKIVELLENTGSVTTKYPFTYAFGPTWTVVVEYDPSLDITSYTYEVVATDIAGNTYTEALDFELTTPTVLDDTNASTPVAPTIETTPVPLAPFLFTIIAIPILRKRKSNK